MSKNDSESTMFWADQLAAQITTRNKFHYTDQEIVQPKEYIVKTSASLSGVLHIGRLSDTIRGDSVVTALKDIGKKAKLIWVAENMDPLRKVPKGVPEDYEEYIGVPVTEIPDPDGNYESYAQKHMEEYFKVVDEFAVNKMEKYSMRDEYKKGTFAPFIKKIIEQAEEVRKINNKYRTHSLKKGWCPWTPVCEKCGKIVTPRVSKIEDGMVHYYCDDYEFETQTAEGCGHKGVADPTKDMGKLVWKSEWAAQWAAWNVCSEGAGKEYQVPNSAWWINGEIVEHVLEAPMPVPIFYEHLMIEGEKMSASVGNVVYPRDWLKVASPELLRLVYNKRLMRTRTFSWRDLPNLYAEYEKLAQVNSGAIEISNEKEKAQFKRLYEISEMSGEEQPLKMSFSQASVMAQLFPKKEDVVATLEKTGQYEPDKDEKIMKRLERAKYWLDNYAPEESRFSLQDSVPEGLEVSDAQRKALHGVADLLRSLEFSSEKELALAMFEVFEREGLKPAEFFQVAYKVLLNRDRGPKLAGFISIIGKEKVIELFSSV